MFFTKVYGDVQSVNYVSYLNMLLRCVSVSRGSGAFSNGSLFQISSLGRGLQNASVKFRTISSCWPLPLPCFLVTSWDGGPCQQKAKLSSTPGFLFPSVSPRWNHSQINTSFKKGLRRPVHCCDTVSMSLRHSCKGFWLFGGLFAKYTVLSHIHFFEDQSGKTKNHSTAGLRKLLVES